MHKGVGSHADDLRFDDAASSLCCFALDRLVDLHGGRAARILEIHGDLHSIAAGKVETQGPQSSESPSRFSDLGGYGASVHEAEALYVDVPGEQHLARTDADDTRGGMRSADAPRLVGQEAG